MAGRDPSGPVADPEVGALAQGVAAHIAGLLEEGSTLAAKARDAGDALTLCQLGEDVAILASAMAVLVRSRR